MVNEKGFSLIEMLVATALFSMVMIVGVGALVSIIDANRKAQSLQSVINNLNFAVEQMSRTVRTGSQYRCQNNSNPPNLSQIQNTRDCNTGAFFAFEEYGGDVTDGADQAAYRFIEEGTGPPSTRQGRLERCTSNCDNVANYVPVTAPEVDIDYFAFHVRGSGINTTGPEANQQARVTFVIVGTAGDTARIRTNFNLQSTVTQRRLDL